MRANWEVSSVFNPATQLDWLREANYTASFLRFRHLGRKRLWLVLAHPVAVKLRARVLFEACILFPSHPSSGQAFSRVGSGRGVCIGVNNFAVPLGRRIWNDWSARYFVYWKQFEKRKSDRWKCLDVYSSWRAEKNGKPWRDQAVPKIIYKWRQQPKTALRIF